jgi:hypothetical protein
MDKIKKIMEIKNGNTEFLSDFFNELEFEKLNYPPHINLKGVSNDCVYVKDNVKNKSLRDVNQTSISYIIKNKNIDETIKNVIEDIVNKFNPRIIWLMTYPPKTYIDFHEDFHKNRHLLTLNYNERFFSYELHPSVLIRNLNNKLSEFKDDINTFNEYFLEFDKTSKIQNLEPYSVFTFGNTVHSFINDSNKLRVNLVFEV